MTMTMTKRTRCCCAPPCSQSQLPQQNACRRGAQQCCLFHGCQALSRLAWQAAACLHSCRALSSRSML